VAQGIEDVAFGEGHSEFLLKVKTRDRRVRGRADGAPPGRLRPRRRLRGAPPE
jgi:hypothetical protein